MKKKIMWFLICIMLLLTGCGSDGSGSSSSGRETSKGDGETSKEDASKEGQYVWQEITITLPEEWEGSYVISEGEDGFAIYQKASYNEENGSGYICGFERTREYLNYGWGESLLAYTDEGVLYYFMQPTDVSCDSDDEDILGEYGEMCRESVQVKASAKIDVSGIHTDADEYVLPLSSILKLDQNNLMNLSDNSLWIARNEIYARHGRQFVNEYLNAYFYRCTWYEGTTPAEQFDENCLSPLEKENLQLLTEAEQEYKALHPYPKEYKMDAVASEDLNGDGQADDISCHLMQTKEGEHQFIIAINGVPYDTAPDVEWIDSLADVFYVTDILEYDNVLEIALLDNGPSEDPVTYFFRYEDGLTYIGQVSGFPFATQNGRMNGFNGVGGITGRVRTDLLGTMYLDGHWWFDGRFITYQDMGWSQAYPSDGHVSLIDLPVHQQMDEDSEVVVIKARTEVFFLGSDLKEWMQVKGRDGTQGYIRVKDGKVMELDKPVDDVFIDLHYFD